MEIVSDATGVEMAKFQKKPLLEGAKELNLVYSGLEDVMSEATSFVIEEALKKDVDFRTAAFVIALKRINHYYNTMGYK